MVSRADRHKLKALSYSGLEANAQMAVTVCESRGQTCDQYRRWPEVWLVLSRTPSVTIQQYS